MDQEVIERLLIYETGWFWGCLRALHSEKKHLILYNAMVVHNIEVDLWHKYFFHAKSHLVDGGEWGKDRNKKKLLSELKMLSTISISSSGFTWFWCEKVKLWIKEWLEVNWALLRLSVNIVSQSWDIIALSLHALKEILLKIQAKWANGKLRTYIRKFFKIFCTAILKFSRNIQLSFQTFTPDSLQCWSYLHTTDLWQCECV